MFLVVAYDIANPKRLRRVARAMKQYGARVQESVFECRLEQPQLAQLISAMKDIIKHREDKVTIYRLCEPCQGQSGRSRGDSTEPSVEEWIC